MTFTAIVNEILGRCNLTSTEASTRVGSAVNRHYRRITSSLNLDTTRFVTRSVTTTPGVRTVTFSDIEKIDRVLDVTTSTAIRVLTPIGMDEQRKAQPGTSEPTTWATQASGADSVTILMDTLPQANYDLQADGTTTLTDLSGSQEPAFPESYHDILTWFCIAEELLKKEKEKLALTYEAKAEKLLAELRHYLADTQASTIPGRTPATGASGTSGGGSATLGGNNYTQTGLLSFDRGSGVVPFAVVETNAPYVPNLGAEFIGNVTTDRLIGRDTAGTGESEQLTVGGGIEFTGSGGIQRSALSGDISATAGSATTAIGANKVTDTMLRDSAAVSVIGRSANSTGDPADIAAGSNGLYLTRQSNAVSFAAIVAADLPAHASRHVSGGADSIKLDDLASPDDNTDLNATTSAHGLLKKLPNDATQYMNGLGAWAQTKVVQIVTGSTSTQKQSSSSTFADSNLTASITPTSASNKVLVIVQQAGVVKDTGDTGVKIKLVRNSTDLLTIAKSAGNTATTAKNSVGTVGGIYLDSPATTSATTYKTQMASDANVANAYCQFDTGETSTILLIEVTP